MGKIVAGIVMGCLLGLLGAGPFVVAAYAENPRVTGYEIRVYLFSGLCNGAVVGAVAGAALMLRRAIEDQPGWPPEEEPPPNRRGRS
jgi:hypothetical protein